jgi:hypothetical protein
MGANISMDISAGLAPAADATNTNDTTAAQSLAFEDKLRQEVILVPEIFIFRLPIPPTPTPTLKPQPKPPTPPRIIHDTAKESIGKRT